MPRFVRDGDGRKPVLRDGATRSRRLCGRLCGQTGGRADGPIDPGRSVSSVNDAPARAVAHAKRAAARAAVAEIAGGMVVGLGTGSTVAFAIEALGERVAAGLAITAVATSLRTDAAARAAGIMLVALPSSGMIDLGIDGVDEIDPSFRAIKGAGGALLREKIVAAAAARMIAIADRSKRVDRLGAAVPVEVLPFACALVIRQVTALGAEPTLRRTATGDVWTSDQGNLVLDCRFGAITDPGSLAERLDAVPGLLGHGIFLDEIDALYVADAAGATRCDRPALLRDG